MSKYRNEYKVLRYDCNYKSNMKLEAMFEHMIDNAVNQNNFLMKDFSGDRDFYWIVYQWDVDILRYPKEGEKIFIDTYATGFYKFYAYRNFDIYDKDENLCLKAKSKWLMLSKDFNLKRIDEDVANLYDYEKGNEVLKRNFKDEDNDYKLSKTFDVRRSDIDSYMHVSNTKYINWLIESIPLDIYRNNKIEKIQITYKNQTKYNDSVDIYMSNIKTLDNKNIINYRIIGKTSKDTKAYGKIYIISNE